MQELLGLSADIQLVLVAGYLAYKVATVGRAVDDRTEDLVLKVLAYGLVAKLIVQGLTAIWATYVAWPTWVSFQPPKGDWFGVAVTGAGVIATAILLAVLWRVAITKAISNTMGRLGVYRDDHESSAWMSVVNTPAKWNHVEIHLDGKEAIYSYLGDVPDSAPGKPVTVNSDGIAIYPTRLYNTEGVETAVEHDEEYSRLVYVPMDRIRWIEVGWRK